jgi:hypothetical protein
VNPTVVAQLVLHAAVVVLAARLARRRREHRPVAIFVAVTLAADLARWGIIFVCPWIQHPGPFGGLPRLIFHIDQALFLSWPLGIMATAWVVFLRGGPWVPLAAGAVAWAALAAGYPTVRGDVLAGAYTAIWAVCALTSLAGAGVWTRRNAHPRPEHVSTLLIALLELSLVTEPCLPTAPRPFDSWHLAQFTYLALWAGLLLVHAGAIWRGFLMLPSSRDSSSRLH